MAANQLRIITFPRLHLTLLAMNSGEYRINGGIGFSVGAPACEFVFSVAADFLFEDHRTDPLSGHELDHLYSILQTERQRQGFSDAITVSIRGEMRTHSGFGSGTAISLACLEALHLMNGSTPTEETLISASGRGGTSGVGIHTYFSGGCVFDLGRRGGVHAPSHRIANAQAPLVVDHLLMPAWDIGLCIPSTIPHKTQAEEQAFFDKTCPLSDSAVYETVYHTLFGLYAAIREADRLTFCRALRAVQDCAWKKAERNEYGTALAEIEHALYACGADAVGMSSLGPSLFFLADDVSAVVDDMRKIRPDCECMLTHPVNHGRSVRFD